jgi:hypothetical protein
MIESTAIDPIMAEIAFDERVGPTAFRLYVMLRNGATLDAAAAAMQRNPDWLKRHERALRDLGYLEIHEVRSAHGRRDRHYKFPTPEHRKIAS